MQIGEIITESKVNQILDKLSDEDIALALNSLTSNLKEGVNDDLQEIRDYIETLSPEAKDALVILLQKEAKDRNLSLSDVKNMSSNTNLNDFEPEPELEPKAKPEKKSSGKGKFIAMTLAALLVYAINLPLPEPEKDDVTRRYEAGEAYRTGKPIPPNVRSAEYTNNYFGGTYKRVSLIYEWKKLSFNTMEADFKVSNQNDFDVKDVKIKCTHYSESGTQIDSNTRTVYKVFPRGSQISIPSFNMGFIHSQVAKSFCEIIDWDKVK